MIEKAVIDALVANPSESLNVETKRWIDPTQTAGIEKIVKGAIALRNRNGGYFVVGFDNDTVAPDLANEPHNARELFHVDVIQGVISRYASDPFEIEIAWGDREGHHYPVIVVPSGVKMPIAAKRDLKDGARTIIREGAVYFRSLNANGAPSTTEARPNDWADIVEICFDNREADVGRFIRRHLAGVDVASLTAFLGRPAPVTPKLCDRALVLIDDGEATFQNAINTRTFSAEERALLAHGFWSVGLVIDPSHSGAVADEQFITRIGASDPKYTGWPIWLDARTLAKPENRPRVIQNGYEYLVVSVSPDFSNHIDFARLNPAGEFFLHRLLQDDGAPTRVRPERALDPMLMILRVAEAMGVGIAFARALGWVPDQTTLGFAFRWHKLKGRQLRAWADPYSDVREGGVAHDDTVESCVQFSLDTPLSAVPQFVDEATRRLFAAFDGTIIQPRITEDLVRRLFERRLGF
jgi:hypothetical protein